MLKLPTIILAFLSVCHFCLAQPLSEEDEQYRRQLHDHRMAMLRRAHSGNYLQGMPPVSEKKLVTVDAAMGLHSNDDLHLYLFIGDRVQVLKNRKFSYEKDRIYLHIPDDMQLQAAFATHGSEDKRFYYGEEYGRFVSVVDDVKKKKLKYGRARAFIRDGGPDAAARMAGKVYVFKGCQMAVRNSWNNWGKPVNLTTMGLPCDVHAAWKENDVMVILKGDKFWRWNPEGTVTGPQAFESMYRMRTGYGLKPTIEKEPPKQEVTDYNGPLPEAGPDEQNGMLQSPSNPELQPAHEFEDFEDLLPLGSKK